MEANAPMTHSIDLICFMVFFPQVGRRFLTTYKSNIL
jgi:hypothetical protein